MSRVVLDNVCKWFAGPRGRQIRAVHGASFEIEDGEFLVLAGPSGCGKTTTLRLIAGLETPSSGVISIDGKIVNSVPAKDRDIAMVFQNLALYPHMTARENMAFGLKARNHSKAEITRRIEEAVNILDLRDCLERKPSELSGGQRQRVALGRAIVLHPKVLLLDEPLSHLDAPLRARMRAELSRLHANLQITMICVTHDQVDAMMLGHRIAVLKEGELQQIAQPDAIYRNPANLFVAGFFGWPPMNLFRGKLLRWGDTLAFEESPLTELTADESPPRFLLEIPPAMIASVRPLAGKPVIMGIRPQNISVAPSDDPSAISARLEKIESLGAESHLHFATGAHNFVMRTPFINAAPDSEARLVFDMEMAHFFNPDDGKTLR